LPIPSPDDAAELVAAELEAAELAAAVCALAPPPQPTNDAQNIVPQIAASRIPLIASALLSQPPRIWKPNVAVC
jgi:hypothetical protein